MNVLDLFSGIGGFSLGLERAGMRTVAFCEIEPWCRALLAERWPDAEIYSDIRELSAQHLTADGIRVDLICGGFPCQDISIAGRGAGIDGARSGLWKEYARLISELRPRFAVVENVPALLDRGLGVVLGDLAEIGYDAEWEVMGVDAIGATQHRERVWILAYPDDTGLEGPIWAGQPHAPREEWAASCGEPLRSVGGLWPPGPNQIDNIPRMADGPTDRAHRLKALGNAVVPQIPEIIGRAIMKCAGTIG